MKKKQFLASVIYIISSFSYAQSLIWAKQIGDSGSEIGFQQTTDKWNNIIITALAGQTVDYDPGPGVYNIQDWYASSSNVIVEKLTSDGNLLWVKHFGASGGDNPRDIHTDDAGNVYIMGTFYGFGDFDPGLPIFNLSSNGSSDMFLLKLDSSGNFLWAKNLGDGTVAYASYFTVDKNQNVYITGDYSGYDLDPGPGNITYPLIGSGRNSYILKLNIHGNYVWSKLVGATISARGTAISTDTTGNIYATGHFNGSGDFDPGPGVFAMTSEGNIDSYVLKLDSLGNFVWCTQIGGPNSDATYHINNDILGNVYIAGTFVSQTDFDPGIGTYYQIPKGDNDIFIEKIDVNGEFVWAKSYGGMNDDEIIDFKIGETGKVFACGNVKSPGQFNLAAKKNIFVAIIDENGREIISKRTLDNGRNNSANGIAYDSFENFYLTGEFSDSLNMDLSNNTHIMSSAGSSDIFLMKHKLRGIYGSFYNDYNGNCIKENNEIGLSGQIAVINPGNIIVQADDNGIWLIDSLPIGNYNITIDTSFNWTSSCSTTFNFSLISNDTLLAVGDFGLTTTNTCTAPYVSVAAPFLTRCFSNQIIYLQACNSQIASLPLTNAYVEFQIDSLFTPQSSNMPFTSLGNNIYRVDLGTINPGQCVNFNMNTSISCAAQLGQSLCIEAKLFPIDSCALPHVIPTSVLPDFISCSLPWDSSHLQVNSWCTNDSVYFTITNQGQNMDCYSPVRLFIDGQYITLDSVLLSINEIDTFVYSGDGRTWRLEVQQHVLHPYSTHSSSTIELCGNTANWTAGLFNALPPYDPNPFVETFCGQVVGSYDPNDKVGLPLGITDTHYIAPNVQIDYLIRFQNTGTSAAHNIIIRDTLDADLDIASVHSGASSHLYSFRVYGPRVLEWTFENIMLPDSSSNEPGSHGFVLFEVNQLPNLNQGTEVNNTADIYFDFNDPVITNTTSHVISNDFQLLSWSIKDTIFLEDCENVTYYGMTYTQSGEYIQLKDGITTDTLVTLYVNIRNTESQLNVTSCESYLAPDGLIHFTSGIKTAIIPNSVGCDSIITINLNINSPNTTIVQNNITLSAVQGLFYQWIDCDNNQPIVGAINQTFTATNNGNYAVIVSKNGCSDTSICYAITSVGILNSTSINYFSLAPNPTQGTIEINFNKNIENVKIEITNILGQSIVKEQKQNGNSVIMEIPGPAGLYFVTITDGKGYKSVVKVIKE